MPKIAVLAKITAKEGKGDELLDAIKAYWPTLDGEAGTEVYVANRDATNPDVFWYYEAYADQAALEAHGASDGFKNFGRSLRDLVAGAPEIHFLTPTLAKGIDL